MDGVSSFMFVFLGFIHASFFDLETGRGDMYCVQFMVSIDCRGKIGEMLMGYSG